MKRNRLTVISVHRQKGVKTKALCLCDCGNEKLLILSQVKSGQVKSCGCLRRELSVLMGESNKKHGEARTNKRTGTYRSWETMRSRCKNLQDSSYVYYGKRGIKVCVRWDSFEKFLLDMGRRPQNMSLDRKDNDGNYTSTNCRWATSTTQARNKSNKKKVKYKGINFPLYLLSDLTGFSYKLLYDRIFRQHWTVHKSIHKSIRRSKINGGS